MGRGLDWRQIVPTARLATTPPAVELTSATSVEDEPAERRDGSPDSPRAPLELSVASELDREDILPKEEWRVKVGAGLLLGPSY